MIYTRKGQRYKNGELIQEQIEDLMELLKLKRKEVSL